METQTQPAPAAAQVILARDYSSGILTFESESLTQSEEVRAIVVNDPDSYAHAVEMGRTIATFIDSVEKWFAPFIDGIRPILDEVYAAKRGVLDVAKADKDYLARAVGKFEQEEKKKQAERDRIAREEERKRQEDANLAAAVNAEQAGMSPASVERILAAPISSLPPTAPATYAKAPGASARENWAAYAVDDDSVAALKALVKAAANDDQWLPYLLPNSSALNQRAKAEKTMFKVPGFVALSTAKSSFRKV